MKKYIITYVKIGHKTGNWNYHTEFSFGDSSEEHYKDALDTYNKRLKNKTVSHAYISEIIKAS